MQNRLKEAVIVSRKGGGWPRTTLLRAVRGDICVERGCSSVDFHPQLHLSGLYQGKMFGAGEQRPVGQGELSVHGLSALFSSAGKI